MNFSAYRLITIKYPKRFNYSLSYKIIQLSLFPFQNQKYNKQSIQHDKRICKIVHVCVKIKTTKNLFI